MWNRESKCDSFKVRPFASFDPGYRLLRPDVNTV